MRKEKSIGLEALLAQQELLVIAHIRTYIKSTKRPKPVEWTPYDSDLEHPHRDVSGLWHDDD